jgi:LysR family nod box-dependent transcriptional activator
VINVRLKNLDLNLLVYLEALLDEKSISRAAERVFLSQSAMSNALGRLRDHFQDELLVQVGRTMTPTPLAQSLVEPVRAVLMQIRSISSATVEFDPAKSKRKITIMTSDYITDVFLNRVITQLWRQAPSIRIELPPLTAGFYEDFERGRIDLLITPEHFLSDEHPSEPLYEDRFTCAVWSKNPLVGNKLTFEQYKTMGHVCVSLGEWRTTTYDAWLLKRHGHVRNIEVVVPSFAMALKFVTGTHRIITCHMRHVQMYARQYSLRVVEPPFDIPPLRERIQWHKHMDRDPALVWFRKMLKSAASEM